MIINPDAIDIFLPKKVAAEKLGMTVRTLDNRVKNDPSFPRPIKRGHNRQSPVRFSNKAIDDYMKIKENDSGTIL